VISVTRSGNTVFADKTQCCYAYTIKHEQAGLSWTKPWSGTGEMAYGATVAVGSSNPVRVSGGTGSGVTTDAVTGSSTCSLSSSTVTITTLTATPENNKCNLTATKAGIKCPALFMMQFRTPYLVDNQGNSGQRLD
jgi:hypothetical protein